MSAIKGYYSLLQHCPDLGRLEAANLGVILFCPEPHFLRARLARSNQRIRRFFGSEDDDGDQINALKAAVEERLEIEADRLRTLADLEHFAATRGNEIQLTPPRPVKVLDPEQDLELLFQHLVGAAKRKVGATVEQRLRESLTDASVAPFVRRDLVVRVPAFHRQRTVPYGYQNGRFNLIQPTSFQQERLSGAISRACRYAVEGRSLFEHADAALGPLQLIVVGEFGAALHEARPVVQDILHDNEVRLFTLQELPQLLEEIRTTGKVQTA